MPEIHDAPDTAQGGGAPAAPAAPPLRKSFEDWAREKLKIDVGEGGRATAVRNGRRIAPISRAAIFNAARSIGRIPVGKLMTEAEFDAAMALARGIEITPS